MKIYPQPVPGPSPAKVIEGPAVQSWHGVEGVSRPGAKSPQEALSNDPRKKPIPHNLGEK